MLSVVRVHIPSDIPIVGCELTPYVLVRKPDKTAFSDDVPETAPIDGYFLRYKWYAAVFLLGLPYLIVLYLQLSVLYIFMLCMKV